MQDKLFTSFTSTIPSTFPSSSPLTIPSWFIVPKEPRKWKGAISDKYKGATTVFTPESSKKEFNLSANEKLNFLDSAITNEIMIKWQQVNKHLHSELSSRKLYLHLHQPKFYQQEEQWQNL